MLDLFSTKCRKCRWFFRNFWFFRLSITIFGWCFFFVFLLLFLRVSLICKLFCSWIEQVFSSSFYSFSLSWIFSCFLFVFQNLGFFSLRVSDWYSFDSCGNYIVFLYSLILRLGIQELVFLPLSESYSFISADIRLWREIICRINYYIARYFFYSSKSS